MFFRFLNKQYCVVKLNFILVYPYRFLAIVVSDNEFKTKKMLFNSGIKLSHNMCSAFLCVHVLYFMIITPHIQIIYYIKKGWRIGNTYIVCFFFCFAEKKQKKYTFLKCRPLWKNRDSNPPDLTCCLPLSWFVLDSPDLFWKQGKQLLILRIFLWCECETLCITLSYPILFLSKSLHWTPP